MNINQNYASDLRVVERIKFDQALYILTMYEKKIRKNNSQIYQSQTIHDAQKMHDNILYGWKNKWDQDLTKPVLKCLTSIEPRVVMDANYMNKQSSQQLKKYNQVFYKYLKRLKIQQEDESNFKILLQKIQEIELNKDFIQKYIIYSSYKLISNLIDMMIKDCQNSANAIEKYSGISGEYFQSVKDLLEPVKDIINTQITGMEIQNLNDWEMGKKSLNLSNFIKNLVNVIKNIRYSQHGSTLFNFQPQIGQITYLIHPILLAIQASFLYELNQKQKINQPSLLKNINLKKQNIKSKAVFINLDGYQSQFNLQFTRNLKKNLMYISFPKEKICKNDNDIQYSKRFYKKIMFNYSQCGYNILDNDRNGQNKNNISISQIDRICYQYQSLTLDPQKYHKNVKNLFSSDSSYHVNQNMYIFPIRSKHIKETFKQIMQCSQDLEPYQSYFIRFILKDFLINQIRQFNPNFIIFSYSGRLHIQDTHFVEIMQQLTKVSNYKLIMYPNLTTYFSTKSNDTFELYDGYLQDNKITYLQKKFNQKNQFTQECISIDYLSKISRFLKVSSGTYNLTKSFEEQSIFSKYKIQIALRYADQIMCVLGKEYRNIDRISFKNKGLKILPKLYQKRIKQLQNMFKNVIPIFYMHLYQTIQQLCFPTLNNNQYYSLLSSFYRQDINQLQTQFNNLVNSMNINISEMDELEKEKKRLQKLIYKQFKNNHFIQISSQKVQQKVYIFLKTPSIFIPLEKQKQLDLRGLYQLQFREDKNSLKILESTSLLYRSDRLNLKNDDNKIPLLIMNYLDDKNHFFQNYLAGVKIEQPSLDQPRLFQQHIDIDKNKHIIHFRRNTPEKHKFIINTQWNFIETDQNLILFWPTEYDFIKASIYKMMRKVYSPVIVPQIYVGKKNQLPLIFYQFNQLFDQIIQPRIGCSTFQKNGLFYIFGGFYGQQKNYLHLQHDIVTFDFQDFKNNVIVKNIKSKLYSQQTINHRISQQKKLNSFIRPRMQYQFYQHNENEFNLEQPMGQNLKKKVIMFGGYGQNFLRPYSMITYYYYQLVFQGRQLQSIQKKLIYDKVVPINTKKMTKNLGIINIHKRISQVNNAPGQIFKKDFTVPDSFALCRCSYSLDKQGCFSYYFRYAFAQDQLKSYKEKVKQLFQNKAQSFAHSPVTIELIKGTHHMILYRKENTKIAVPLYYEIPSDQIIKFNNNKIVKLTQQCIISIIESLQTIVFCIIKHQIYTQGKCFLAEFDLKTSQNLNIFPDQTFSIVLKKIEKFEVDLSMHCLFSNGKYILIYHGERLSNSPKLKQYYLTRSLKKKEISSKIVIAPRKSQQGQIKPQICYSVFFFDGMKLKSFEFCSFSSQMIVHLFIQELEFMQNQNLQWKKLEKNNYKIKFCLEDKRQINLKKLNFIQGKLIYQRQNKDINMRGIRLALEYNKKQHYCEINLINTQIIYAILTTQIRETIQNQMEDKSLVSKNIIRKLYQNYIDLGFE